MQNSRILLVWFFQSYNIQYIDLTCASPEWPGARVLPTT